MKKLTELFAFQAAKQELRCSKVQRFLILALLVLSSYFSKGQNYPFFITSSAMIAGLENNNFFKIDPLPALPFLSTSTSTHNFKFGQDFQNLPVAQNSARGIFYGGNLGISQDKSDYGIMFGKWSLNGAWQKVYSLSNPFATTISPGINYLVNYHRWGNYSAHFGLREASSSLIAWYGEGSPPPDNTVKDAVITWSSEYGTPSNRLIFQSIEGTDINGSASMNHEAKEWATILSNGNFGSGTANPDAQFTIKSLSMNSLFKTIDGIGTIPFEISSMGLIKMSKLVNPDGVSTKLLVVKPNGIVSSENLGYVSNGLNWELYGNDLSSSTAIRKLGSINAENFELITNDKTFLKFNGDNSLYEGFSNFTKNVSISGGTSATGAPTGGYPINDPNYSLTIKTSFFTGNGFDKYGIINCLDNNNLEVFTIGNTSMTMFGWWDASTGVPIKKFRHTISPIFVQFDASAGIDLNGGDVTLEKNLLPKTTANSDIGSNLKRFRDVWCSGTVTSSDFRLKEKIRPIEYGLQTVLKLRPYSYNLKNSASTVHHGFIAQDLQKIFRNSVWLGSETDSTYLGVRF